MLLPRPPCLLSRAAETLRQRHWGDIQLRSRQGEIISALATGQDVLAILSTGEGKSLCFQLGGLLLGGLTLVVSPLLALIADQVQQLQARGIHTASLTSSQTKSQKEEVLRHLRQRNCQFLYLSPEQLGSIPLNQALSASPPHLLVIDEAHCLSLWGHDFRLAYRRIPQFIAQFKHRPVVAAFTATAPPEVERDIKNNLGLVEPRVFRTAPLGANISLTVRSCWTPYGKERVLLSSFADRKSLIYAGTRDGIEALAQWLKNHLSLPVWSYHAGLSAAQRQQAFDGFRTVRSGIMVASTAFGMGIDIPDIEQVIHWQSPGSLLSYVQEVGRAGRGGQAAQAVLLRAWGEEAKVPVSEVEPELMQAFWHHLKRTGSILRVQDRLSLPPTTLNLLLGLGLETGWLTSRRPLEYQVSQELTRLKKKAILQRLRGLQVNRREHAQAMARYIRTHQCRRVFLAWYFGSGAAEPCGNCDRCG